MKTSSLDKLFMSTKPQDMVVKPNSALPGSVRMIPLHNDMSHSQAIRFSDRHDPAQDHQSNYLHVLVEIRGNRIRKARQTVHRRFFAHGGKCLNDAPIKLRQKTFPRHVNSNIVRFLNLHNIDNILEDTLILKTRKSIRMRDFTFISIRP